MVAIGKSKSIVFVVAFSMAMTTLFLPCTWASNGPEKSKPPSVSNLSKKQVKPTVIDPEEEPLSAYEAHHEQARQASGRSIGRLLLGLLAVLALFGGFARWGLPRLVARYPQFFAYWQRHSAGNVSAKEPDKTAESAGVSPVEHEISELVSPAGTLRLLSSTLLNTSQELHLVEVGNRQLIIVSTMDGVSILCDLTAPVQKSVANPIHTVQDLFPSIATQRPLSETATPSKTSAPEPPVVNTVKKLDPMPLHKKEAISSVGHKPYARPPKSKSYSKVVSVPRQKVSFPKSEMSIELLGDYDDIF